MKIGLVVYVQGRGLHGTDFSDRVRPKVKKKNFSPGPVQPKTEIEAQAQPERKIEI